MIEIDKSLQAARFDDDEIALVNGIVSGGKKNLSLSDREKLTIGGFDKSDVEFINTLVELRAKEFKFLSDQELRKLPLTARQAYEKDWFKYQAQVARERRRTRPEKTEAEKNGDRLRAMSADQLRKAENDCLRYGAQK